MTTENLVPRLEMCKEIPEGCFADSALVWLVSKTSGKSFVFPRKFHISSEKSVIGAPAPTLAEIMEALPRSICADGQKYYLGQLSDTETCRWKICYGASSFYGLAILRGPCAADKNPAIAALRVWLSLNDEGGLK